jgi:hypothetical protein
MGRFGANREFTVCDGCGHPRMAHYGGGCYCGCTLATSAGSELLRSGGSPASEPADLAGALHARVEAARRGTGRAWALIEEVAQLRREERADEALRLAGLAQDAAETIHEKTAAATVAVAALCDLWRDEEARHLGEDALRQDASPYLARALARAWMLGFVATGLEEFRVRAHERFRSADEAERVVA